MIKFTEFPTHTNWVKGTYNNKYKFMAKLFDTSLELDYGIDDGRVSVLSVFDPDGKEIISYYRGWSKTPDKEHQEMYNSILEFLENAPRRFD